jgi:hypothetical protein
MEVLNRIILSDIKITSSLYHLIFSAHHCYMLHSNPNEAYSIGSRLDIKL